MIIKGLADTLQMRVLDITSKNPFSKYNCKEYFPNLANMELNHLKCVSNKEIVIPTREASILMYFTEEYIKNIQNAVRSTVAPVKMNLLFIFQSKILDFKFFIIRPVLKKNK